MPVALHLAETREELELLQSGTGPFVPMLQSFDAWHPDVIPRGTRPLDFLRALGQAHRALVIHGNYLNSEEITFLAALAARMSLVYCPRTHAYFGHEPYPLASLLAAGVNVAVGTDSRASNPDLDLWEELRYLQRHFGDAVAPADVLRMATLRPPPRWASTRTAACWPKASGLADDRSVTGWRCPRPVRTPLRWAGAVIRHPSHTERFRNP